MSSKPGLDRVGRTGIQGIQFSLGGRYLPGAALEEPSVHGPAYDISGACGDSRRQPRGDKTYDSYRLGLQVHLLGVSGELPLGVSGILCKRGLS